ncbi:MAG: polyisoprenoid-binding protein [Crocinitomicaceae bacterium]|nr:polyisoprenoid-binding protein [Crocinitomicaceae bacterium]
MKKIGMIAMMFMFSGTMLAQKAKDWKIDRSHSSVRFEVKHLVSMTPGKFDDFSGTIAFDQKDLKNSKVTFEIDVNSINTDNEKRDGHLKSADFFNTEKYPNMKFESTEFLKKEDGLYHVKGKLTIKDQTKDVVLPLKITGIADNPWNKEAQVMGVSIHTTIKRSDYGVGVGDYASDAVIGDEVEIHIAMELGADK